MDSVHGLFDVEVDENGALHLFVPEGNDGISPDGFLRDHEEGPQAEAAEHGPGGQGSVAPPPLSIVLMVTGTRGDVQPFIALGLGLKAYGHRVRLASHAVYRDWVEGFGLEFYPLGGDPKVLSEFIVRNRGVIPKHLGTAVDSGKEVREVLFSTFKACTEPDPASPSSPPFTAQAIIANPPSYGHIHCAEKLGIPLHMCFTMPWTPTRAFASPLTRVPYKSATLNKLSYAAIAEFIYASMFHMINKFRVEELGLEPIRAGNHGGLLVDRHKVPFMYCWSEAVVPKPADWPSYVDVVGYLFLEEADLSSFQPPQELVAFLEAGEPPVYVGFGSLMVDDPERLTRMVLDAAAQAGVRLLISKGWGGLGEGIGEVGEGVMLLETAVPHDWLFKHCSAVVHHGGAGTTAAGIKAGCPTTIVPFFGDQHFWGEAVCSMGLGPAAIPVDKLTTEKLADALAFMRRPEAKAAAVAAAEKIGGEDGVQQAVDCFHRHLPVQKLLAGERVEWDLCTPRPLNVLHEAGAGLINVVREPVRGYRKTGAMGAVKGAAVGVANLGYRPLKGVLLSAKGVAHDLGRSSNHISDSE